MKIFEYTKNKSSFLLTSVKEDGGYGIRVEFIPRSSGEMKIGERSFKVINGKCSVELCGITDGIYTPIFKDEWGESSICERLKFEAGSAVPFYAPEEELFQVKRKLISLENESLCLKERLTSLEKSVYGNKIF